MAFQFNTINSALGQQNIFDPNAPSQQNGQMPQQSIFQTSGPSSQSSMPSGGVPAPQSVQRSAPMVAPNQKAAVYAGVKGTDTSKATGAIQTGIQNAQATLQAKANEFGKTAEGLKSQNGLGAATVSKAIAGDDKAFQETQTRLSQSGPKRIDAFKGLDDSELPTLSAPLQNENTWGEIFRPQAGANFTRGQSNYEDLLLGRNADFQNVARALQTQSEALTKQNTDMVDSETKKAQEMLDTDWKTQTDAIRGELSGGSKSILDALKAREAEEEAKRSGLDLSALTQAELSKLRPDIVQNLQAAGLGGWERLLDDPSITSGLKDYLSVNKDVNYQDLVSQDEADRFNRINSLLGNGSLLTPGQGAGAQYNFDRNGANSFIDQVIRGRAEQTQRTLAEGRAAAAAQEEAARKLAAEEQARKIELEAQKQVMKREFQKRQKSNQALQ